MPLLNLFLAAESRRELEPLALLKIFLQVLDALVPALILSLELGLLFLPRNAIEVGGAELLEGLRSRQAG